MEDSYPPEADGGSSPPHATKKIPNENWGFFYVYIFYLITYLKPALMHQYLKPAAPHSSYS